MKRSLFLLFLFVSVTLSAQDTIIKMNGDLVVAKVHLISERTIEYDQKDSLRTLRTVLPKSEVFMIKYANGTRESFPKEQPKEVKPKSTEGYTLLLIHPFVGDTLDLYEKKKYHIFPSYYFSNADFKYATFLQKPDGGIIIRAALKNGKVLDKVSSQKELDHVRKKIGGNNNNSTGAGMAVGVIFGGLIIGILGVIVIAGAFLGL